MRSLRTRITIGVVAITSAVVLVGAIGAWLTVYTTLMRGIDQELQGRMGFLQRVYDRPPPPPRAGEGEHSPDRAPPGLRPSERRWFEVVDPDGHQVFRNLPDENTFVGRDLPVGVPAVVRFADGRRTRVIYRAGEKPGWRLWVARDLEPLAEELGRLAAVLAGLWLGASVLAWIAIALLGSRLLRPLADLTATIDRLGPDDLAARVTDSAGPREVRGLVLRLNSLLDRLEEAFRREQTTIANIAHELRTPVTVLRTALEFRLMAPGNREEEAVLRDCFRTVERMQVVVANLLLLARLEASREPLETEPTDIAALLREQLVPWRERADQRGQAVRIDAAEGLVIDTAPGHLRLVIDNLIGNAVAHGPQGSQIAVRLADGALVVENPLAGPVDATQLGLAFYRADSARHDGCHAGLGLALSRRLLRLLGGELLLTADHGVFRAEARFAQPS